MFCWIDESLPAVTPGNRLRQRGPDPVLYDSEGLRMEVVGAYVGLSQDRALYASFRRHDAHCFRHLLGVHRTTFVRPAAKRWGVKQRRWQRRLARVAPDPPLAILDRLPVSACQFARAPRGPRFRGEAA